MMLTDPRRVYVFDLGASFPRSLLPPSSQPTMSPQVDSGTSFFGPWPWWGWVALGSLRVLGYALSQGGSNGSEGVPSQPLLGRCGFPICRNDSSPTIASTRPQTK
jgi:hypothetical protein